MKNDSPFFLNIRLIIVLEVGFRFEKPIFLTWSGVALMANMAGGGSWYKASKGAAESRQTPCRLHTILLYYPCRQALRLPLNPHKEPEKLVMNWRLSSNHILYPFTIVVVYLNRVLALFTNIYGLRFTRSESSFCFVDIEAVSEFELFLLLALRRSLNFFFFAAKS